MLVHVIPVPAPINSGIVVSGNELIFGIGSSEQGVPAGVYLFAPAR
jgi:hypothetical protein